jgi:hypothetical protein
MIVFNIFFISNVLQKANFNFILFFILCPNEKKKIIIYIPRFSHTKIYEENKNQLVD